MGAEKKYVSHLGETRLNNQGYKMTIIEYNGYDHIVVEFAEPYHWITESKYSCFINGGIKNHYAPTASGIGITGKKYPTCDENGNHTREYTVWSNILKRCCIPSVQKRNPSYIGVTVADEWKYFENFYEWLHGQENYEAVSQLENYALDKDILCKGNRIYAPDKCTLVPTRVNNLLLKPTRTKGVLPAGVIYYPRNKKYGVGCGGRQRRVFLGLYKTIEEAFEVYKQYKETEIQCTATEEFNKGTITRQCYEALMAYRVSITD